MTAHPHDGGAYGKRQQQTPHYRPLGPTESRTGSPPLRSLEPYTQDGRRPMRLLPRVLVCLHTVEQPQHMWLTSLVRRLQFDNGIEARGKQRCGRNHGLLPPLLLFPHREGRRAVAHGTGSSTHKKTPTWNGRGRHRHAAAPFPRKDVSAPCRAGLLARGIPLLSAPSQGKAPQWSLQISIRLQLRGSDGFAPSSLVTGSDCDQPYQRHMQFCRGAYGSTLGFVKDISEGIEAYLHDPSPIYMSSESRTR
jgi:hypothetical protein